MPIPGQVLSLPVTRGSILRASLSAALASRASSPPPPTPVITRSKPHSPETLVMADPRLQASYTWGKSIDDTSSVSGGLGATGAVAQAYPQDPFNTHPEKGPSTFDVGHAFTLSAVQDLHLEDWSALHSVSSKGDRGMADHGHLDDHEWLTLYRLLRSPADRRWLQRS